MKVHELKIEPQYFEAVMNGSKTFEIRFNDRDYKVGDHLILHEYYKGAYTGFQLQVDVTYIADYAQNNGFVVMAISNVEEDEYNREQQLEYQAWQEQKDFLFEKMHRYYALAIKSNALFRKANNLKRQALKAHIYSSKNAMEATYDKQQLEEEIELLAAQLEEKEREVRLLNLKIKSIDEQHVLAYNQLQAAYFSERRKNGSSMPTLD